MDDYQPRDATCPKCGYENYSPDAYGCLNCGHILRGAVSVCPKCGYENTRGMVECLNCGHTLLETEPAESNDVELLSIDDPELAASVQEKLTAADLSFYFDNDTTGSGTAVRVPGGQAARAREVLDDILNAPEPPEPRYCPHCNKKYRPEDYDPFAPRHLCTRCGGELPRSG